MQRLTGVIEGASPIAVAMAKIPEITVDVVSSVSYCVHTHTHTHTHTQTQPHCFPLSNCLVHKLTNRAVGVSSA